MVCHEKKKPWIIKTDEEEESQVSSIYHIFDNIKRENSSKLRKNTPIQTQEAQGTKNRKDQKSNGP